MSITAERLREVLAYDAESGAFTRNVRTAQRHQVGDRADFLVTSGGLRGYRRVSVDSQRHLAHRLAWLYVHGEWPEGEIDHVNGDRADNRIGNLRDVPRQVNAENMRRPRKDNKSGFLGVHWHAQTNKWRARVQVNGRAVEAGLFDDPSEAHAAYVAKKREVHKGCTL